MAISLLFATSVAVSAQVCVPPVLENGEVIESTHDDSSWVGQFKCQAGFTLVGSSKTKCKNGLWNTQPPVCTAVGVCDYRNLPSVKHARLVMRKEFRGAVWRYKCKKGFKRYGEGKVYCDGSSWNTFKTPICARPGCPIDQVSELRYGQVKSIDDAVYRYTCDDESKLVGSTLIWCDGFQWNDTIPQCHREASAPSMQLQTEDLDIEMDDEVEVDSAAPLTVICKSTGGFPEPTISILIDDDEVNEGQKSSNSYTFTPERHHSGSTIKCVAKNSATTEEKSTSSILHVKYEPESVYLTNPSHGRASELVTVTCTSDIAFPAPELSFQISEVVQIIDEVIEYQKVRSGAYISTIERMFTLPQHVDEITVQCAVDGRVFNETNIVIYSPSTGIEMNHEGDKITAQEGEMLNVKCTALDGNPTPAVQISVDGDIVEEDIGSASIEIPVSKESQEITCSAFNDAMDQPIYIYKSLDVLYGPSEVKIDGVNEELEHGEIFLTCSATESNPPATFLWKVYQDGEEFEGFEVIAANADESSITMSANPAYKSVDATCSVDHATGLVEASHHVDIIYGPSHVAIEGADQVVATERVSLTCRASDSNPVSLLGWRILEDDEERSSLSTSAAASEITASFYPLSDTKRVVAHCTAVNQHGTSHLVATHTVDILYPTTTLATTTTELQTQRNTNEAATERLSTTNQNMQTETEGITTEGQTTRFSVESATELLGSESNIDVFSEDAYATEAIDYQEHYADATTFKEAIQYNDYEQYTQHTTEDMKDTDDFKIHISNLKEPTEEATVTYRLIKKLSERIDSDEDGTSHEERMSSDEARASNEEDYVVKAKTRTSTNGVESSNFKERKTVMSARYTTDSSSNVQQSILYIIFIQIVIKMFN